MAYTKTVGGNTYTSYRPIKTTEDDDDGFWGFVRDNILHPVRDFVLDPENVLTAAGYALGGPAGAAIGKAAGGFADRIGEEYLGTGTGLREASPITLGSTARDLGTGYLYGQGIEAAAPHVGRFTQGIFGGDGAGAVAGAGAGAGAGGASAAPIATASGAPTISPVPGIAGASRVPPMVGAPVSSRAAGGALSLAPTSTLAPAAASTAPASRTVGQAASAEGGGFFDRLTGFWDDLSGLEKAALLSQGLGTAANIYSSHQAGQFREEQQEMLEEDRRRRENVGRIIAELLGRELEG